MSSSSTGYGNVRIEPVRRVLSTVVSPSEDPERSYWREYETTLQKFAEYKLQVREEIKKIRQGYSIYEEGVKERDAVLLDYLQELEGLNAVISRNASRVSDRNGYLQTELQKASAEIQDFEIKNRRLDVRIQSLLEENQRLAAQVRQRDERIIALQRLVSQIGVENDTMGPGGASAQRSTASRFLGGGDVSAAGAAGAAITEADGDRLPSYSDAIRAGARDNRPRTRIFGSRGRVHPAERSGDAQLAQRSSRGCNIM